MCCLIFPCLVLLNCCQLFSHLLAICLLSYDSIYSLSPTVHCGFVLFVSPCVAPCYFLDYWTYVSYSIICLLPQLQYKLVSVKLMVFLVCIWVYSTTLHTICPSSESARMSTHCKAWQWFPTIQWMNRIKWLTMNDLDQQSEKIVLLW